MGKYQAYPEYKDSGVEWLDKLPIHWSIPSLKMVMDVRDGTHDTPQYIEQSEDSFPLVTSKDVTSGKLLFSDCKYISKIDYLSIISRSKVDVGDILMPMIGTVGSPIVVKERSDFAIKNLALFKTSTNRSINRWFLNYFLQSNECNTQFSLEARGGVQNFVSLGTLRDLGFLQAPLDEQEKIASFLDHEAAKIDTLIDKQQQLIQLLKEKRQAVISHAVTKGLNPNAPMRESGVEWLGEVPEHWIVTQLKFYTLDMQTGPFGSQLHAEDYVANEIPLINPAHMISGELIPDPNVTVDEATQERLSRHKLSAGDIIFARRGELGRCAVVQEEHEGWLCGTGSLKAKLNKLLTPEYAYLLITSDGVISELSLESKGSTMDNLNTETLGRVRIPVPPKSEQNQILQYVEKVSGKYASLVSKAETAINLMQERRTALISAAVTGTIDVRDWQVPALMQNKEAV